MARNSAPRAALLLVVFFGPRGGIIGSDVVVARQGGPRRDGEGAAGDVALDDGLLVDRHLVASDDVSLHGAPDDQVRYCWEMKQSGLNGALNGAKP